MKGIVPTLWLTGLSGAGKSTLAHALSSHPYFAERRVAVLDGDVMRAGLCSDLGFSAADRHENVRRIAEVAKLLNGAGVHVICALISPLRADRSLARSIIGADGFIEVHVATSLEACEARDPKGLYKRARAGQIAEFTGISSAYETPVDPALTLNTAEASLEDCLARLLGELRARGG